jgi:hypothetical protein
MPRRTISAPGLAVVQRYAVTTTEPVMKKPNTRISEAQKPESRKKPSTANKSRVAKPEAPGSHVRADTKLGAIIALMRRREGATIAEMAKATAWQVHSVRGAISGTLKGKLALNITSEMKDGVRRYRLG